jgi:precorrin-6B C5,15-methyltransferase / cobalt-precorrin-6B C5,C15-methyltransferase
MRIQVVGVGLGLQDLTAHHRDIIVRADLLIGGKRLLALFPDSPAEKKAIGKDLKEVIACIRRHMARRSIVVLASGDPLFYGIGANLVEAFGAERVVIHPNVSAAAAAFARIGQPWQEARVVSLHGKRNPGVLLELLRSEDTVAVLTDPAHDPAGLARLLLEHDLGSFRMCVLEALGTASERVGWHELRPAASMKFQEPNIVVLKRCHDSADRQRPLVLGAPDAWFDHEKGLITKAEVRAVTLSKLRLGPRHTLWDLGAGSGSVAVEAGLFITTGKILAVEKDLQRCEQIKANAKRFGVKNLRAVQATLPEGLAGLPRPHRVFIGGGGRDLPGIITAAARGLRPDGILVVNTVLLKNLEAAAETLRQLGFRTEIVQVQILRGQDMPFSTRLEALNPVWIITGVRKAQGGGRRAEGGRRKGEVGSWKLEGGGGKYR